MTSMDKLNEIFRTVFDDNTIQITPEMTADSIEGWDSLSHVNLIVAVEAAFKIKFSNKELLTFKNVGDLHAAISAKAGR